MTFPTQISWTFRFLAVLSLMQFPASALTQAELIRFAAAIEASSNPQALEDYQTLKEAGILRVSGATEDPRAELAFRILDRNQPPVTEAFRRLKAAGFLRALDPQAGLSKKMLEELQEVSLGIRAALSELNQLDGLAAEYHRSGASRRIRIRRGMLSRIDAATNLLDQATKRFAPMGHRTEPVIQKTRSALEEAIEIAAERNLWFRKHFLDPVSRPARSPSANPKAKEKPVADRIISSLEELLKRTAK